MSVFTETLDDLLKICAEFQPVDAEKIRDEAALVAKEQHHRASASLAALEDRWFDSLKTSPDYSVYGDPSYIIDAWGCWIIYSRKYLRNITGENSLTAGHSILSRIAGAQTILDVGCGFGHTAAAWKELVPGAAVIGTNVPDTLQMQVAERMGERYDFTMRDAAPNCSADLCFASEYFEHFHEPIAHLEEIVETAQPRMFLVANAFGQRAIGHFNTYRVEGRPVAGKKMGRVFGLAMKKLGYRKVPTRLWNQRPAFYARVVRRK